MPDIIINSLNAIYPLAIPLKETLAERIVCIKTAKRNNLLTPGQICENVYFVKKGLIRIYHKNEDDKETTVWLMKEGEVAMAVSSFIYQKPGVVYIGALEDTELGYISRKTLLELCYLFPEFEKTRIFLVEKYYSQCEDRLLATLMQTAKEKYEYFLEKHPELVKRVPWKYIASYLGLTQATLSRIRAGKF